MYCAPRDVKDIRVQERRLYDEHHEVRSHEHARAGWAHDQALRDFESYSTVVRYDANGPIARDSSRVTHRQDFESRSGLAIELLAESKAAAKHPGMDRALAFLEAIASRDASAGDAFFSYRDRLNAAWERYEDARAKMLASLAQWESGATDPKEAGRLFSATIQTQAAWRAADCAVAGLIDAPPIARSAMPVAAWTQAQAQTSELVRFTADFGAVFAHEAPRPAIDVIAIARRQARDTTDEAETSLWPVAEARALASITDAKARDVLQRVFAEREAVRAERARFGEYAR